MLTYNKQQLAAQAKELGFIRDTFEKVLRLTEVLKFMDGDPLLSSGLALKGGTAINLTMFNLPRLSVDAKHSARSPSKASLLRSGVNGC